MISYRRKYRIISFMAVLLLFAEIAITPIGSNLITLSIGQIKDIIAECNKPEYVEKIVTGHTIHDNEKGEDVEILVVNVAGEVSLKPVFKLVQTAQKYAREEKISFEKAFWKKAMRIDKKDYERRAEIFGYTLSTYLESEYGYSYKTILNFGSSELPNVLTIPEKVDDASIIAIAEDGFSETTFKQVVLPDSITEIYKRAFYRCLLLTRINLPDNILEIGDEAFKDCDALIEITLPKRLSKVGEYVFNNCSVLQNAIIPYGVTELGRGMFGGCISLNQVSIPKSVGTVNKDSFSGCTGLKYVKLSTGVRKIDKDSFKNCSSLESINIPDSLEIIGETAFEGCSSIKSFAFTSGLQEFGIGSFKDCTAIEKIDIPSTVKILPEEIFSGCSSLTFVKIPVAIKQVGFHAFSGCDALKTIEYIGLKDEWNKIKKDELSDFPGSAHVVFESELY